MGMLTQSALGICEFNQVQIKKEEENPESSKKQNLNLLFAGNYLHNIYIVFTSIYIAFTLY